MERIMTIKQVSAKINLRMNKGDSGDYDNLTDYVKQEAFNKAITDGVGRMKIGKTQLQDGDEETVGRVDDLQILLKTQPLTVRNKGIFAQSNKLPIDYGSFKRLTPTVSKGSCSSVTIKSHLREEANVDDLLSIPSFNFEETFHTLIGDKAHIYHNKDFTVDKAVLTYYRKPKVYDFKKPDTKVEFNERLCELFVEEACKIIASDIESLNQERLLEQRRNDND
jgi:hypothetical protein